MSTYDLVHEKALAAKKAGEKLAVTSTATKNKALFAMADALIENKAEILAANAKDIEIAKSNNMKTSMIDRLLLNDTRIDGMSEGLLQVARLEDPVGNVLSGRTLPNGVTITKVRVSLCLIGIFY